MQCTFVGFVNHKNVRYNLIIFGGMRFCGIALSYFSAFIRYVINRVSIGIAVLVFSSNIYGTVINHQLRANFFAPLNIYSPHFAFLKIWQNNVLLVYNMLILRPIKRFCLIGASNFMINYFAQHFGYI